MIHADLPENFLDSPIRQNETYVPVKFIGNSNKIDL